MLREGKKSRALLYFLISVFLILSVIPFKLLAFGPPTAGDWAKQSPTWVDKQTITVGDTTFKALDCALSANNDTVNICDYMGKHGFPVTESQGIILLADKNLLASDGKTYKTIIAIKYSDTSKGTYYLFDPTGANAVGYSSSPTISNTEKGPGPSDVPTDAGFNTLKFNGLVNLTSRSGDGKPADSNTWEDAKVIFSTSTGNTVDYSVTGTEPGKISAYGKAYKYNELTVKYNYGNFNINQVYSLVVARRMSGADCVSGDDTGVTKGGVCNLNYEGKTSFKFDKAGIITLIDKDGKEKATTLNVKSLTTDKGIDIEVTETLDSPIDQALSSAVKAMAGVVENGLKYIMDSNYKLLMSTPKYVLAVGVEGAWTNIRNIALSLLVLALLIIAFANVLQIDIETYGLNRMIPKIILAIIFTSLSWLIVEFFFDFTAALQAQAVGLVGGKFGLDVFGESFKLGMPNTGEVLGKIGVVILFVVLLFVVWICGIILWFSLLLRVVMLAFLLAVAPLAFIFSIMPFTEGLYKQWWQEFWKWMFMGPVAVAIIALGYIIASGFGYGASEMSVSYSSVDPASPSSNIMMGLVIFGASLVMASTLPLQWGGAIMKNWRGIGKKAWGSTGGALLGGMGKLAKSGGKAAIGMTGIPGGLKQTKQGLLDYFAQGRQLRENKWAQRTSLGKVGTDQDVMERKLYDARVAKAGENMGVSSAGQPKLISRFKTASSDFEKAAIMREMANQGDLEKLFAADGLIDPETGGWIQPTANKETEKDLYDKQEHAINAAKMQAREAAGMAVTAMAGRDQALEKSVKDKQAELFYAAANGYAKSGTSASSAGRYASATLAAVNAGQKNKKLNEKRMNILDDATAKQAASFISPTSIRDIIDNPNNATDKVRNKTKDFIKRMDEEGSYNPTALGKEMYEALEYFNTGGAVEMPPAQTGSTSSSGPNHPNWPEDTTRFDG